MVLSLTQVEEFFSEWKQAEDEWGLGSLFGEEEEGPVEMVAGELVEAAGEVVEEVVTEVATVVLGKEGEEETTSVSLMEIARGESGGGANDGSRNLLM